MYWIRGIDVLPVLLHESEIKAKVKEYQQTLKEIS
jgi:hypothetical protein